MLKDEEIDQARYEVKMARQLDKWNETVFEKADQARTLVWLKIPPA